MTLHDELVGTRSCAQEMIPKCAAFSLHVEDCVETDTLMKVTGMLKEKVEKHDKANGTSYYEQLIEGRGIKLDDDWIDDPNSTMQTLLMVNSPDYFLIASREESEKSPAVAVANEEEAEGGGEVGEGDNLNLNQSSTDQDEERETSAVV